MVNSSRVRIVAIMGLALVTWCGVGAVAAQSLGDVARREADRRKAVKGPVAVYTNDNVRPVPAPEPRPATAPPAPGEGAPREAAAPPAGTTAPAGDAAAASKDPKQDREYWRKRMADLQTLRDRNAFMMEAVQSRINGLWADFTARDDPEQRAVIAAERQRALAEMERMKKVQEAVDKQIADLYEEARRANVPPAWLR